MKKNTLVILSDLWGIHKSEWVSYYTERLAPFFEIRYYDSCELAGIDTTVLSKEQIHKAFVGGGIDRAVQQLTNVLSSEPVHILAFSIGGYIAWKAIEKGITNHQVCLVSATRLRYETQKSKAAIQLVYGEKDAYKPSPEWFEAMEIAPVILPDVTHDLYTDAIAAHQICEMLLLDKHIDTIIAPR